MSDKLGDWLKEYDRYLDGEIEYKDLSPRPAPPPPTEAMTTGEARSLVAEAYASARREANRFALLVAISVGGVTAVLIAVHVPWWGTLGAQWLTGLALTKSYIWHIWHKTRKDARSQQKRDPALDETGKDRE